LFSDWRWLQFPPSVWAAAAMLHAMGQHWDETVNILDLLQVTKVLVPFNQSFCSRSPNCIALNELIQLLIWFKNCRRELKSAMSWLWS